MTNGSMIKYESILLEGKSSITVASKYFVEKRIAGVKQKIETIMHQAV